MLNMWLRKKKSDRKLSIETIGLQRYNVDVSAFLLRHPQLRLHVIQDSQTIRFVNLQPNYFCDNETPKYSNHDSFEEDHSLRQKQLPASALSMNFSKHINFVNSSVDIWKQV